VVEEGDICILLVRLHKQMLTMRPAVAHAPISLVSAVTSVCTARSDNGSCRLTSG
jgi:hypothetical protein